ncbi:MAG TPA: uroporphyrinogen-III C-methyltransferase [Sedimenticola sp.]|nr:uroporphyrinogen-III C-methyltransferase [Sedimenticola sp.]
MDYLPIFLDIKGKPCLIVGGGEVAGRKASLLLNAGARICVISPALGPSLSKLREEGEIRHEAREYRQGDLDGVHLVIAATDDTGVNQRLSKEAAARRIPANIVDQPGLSSFIMPSIVDRSPVIAAVSTGGASPVLARLIRGRLESLIPSGYGRLAELAGRFRDRVKARFSNPTDRRRFWEDALQGGIAERVFSGHEEEADRLMEQALAETGPSDGVGEVYLIGGGPGDPDLLTFRALRLMQQADVVVYDRLIAKPILEMTRRDAERVYVGKENNHHVMCQEDINRLLAKLAKQGKRVVRLKGGDPFIFGRGGEEIDTLAAEGIPFQVVPGVTAASGCASYSGIPLTHRDHAHAAVFVTGHLKDGSLNLNWKALAQPQQTLVFYMGLLSLPYICRELQAHGMPADMPAALVQKGTTPQQKVYTGTLGTLTGIAEREQPKPPTLIIVGEVVKLRDKLNWYQGAEEAALKASQPFEPEAWPKTGQACS